MVVNELLSTESFPTVCRSTCFGICVMMGRLTTCVASFASILVRANSLALPGAVAALNGVAAAMVWLLEETKGAPMPQTIAEMEALKLKKGRGKIIRR